MMVTDLHRAMVTLEVENSLLPGVKEKVCEKLWDYQIFPLKKVNSQEGWGQHCQVRLGATFKKQGGQTGGAVKESWLID